MRSIATSSSSSYTLPSWLVQSVSLLTAATILSTTTITAFSPHSPLTTSKTNPNLNKFSQSTLSSTTNNDSTSSTTTTTTNDTSELRKLGNELILSAARYHGATDKMVSIDWKADRIVVTVDVSLDEEYEGGESVFGELLEEEFDDDLDYDDEEEDFEEYEDDLEEEDFESLQAQLGLQVEEESPQSNRIDLTLIARTINEYLSADGENSPKFKIAQLHEIEVTTPPFDNVLRVNAPGGVNMFEVYKGFDVIVDYWEVPKKKKKKSGKAGKEVINVDSANEEEEEEEPKRMQKVVEGKLVGRDEEKGVTMVNVKGRIMKIKNDMIESVKLPKAKREKGVK